MNSLLLRVDPSLPLPVYEQIRSQIARLSASGQVPSETRLPTIRQLASDLGLAKGTVERAYLLLEADGVIATRGRSGTFLIGRPTTRGGRPSKAHQDLAVAAEGLAVTTRQLGLGDEDALAALRRALDRLA